MPDEPRPILSPVANAVVYGLLAWAVFLIAIATAGEQAFGLDLRWIADIAWWSCVAASLMTLICFISALISWRASRTSARGENP